MPPRDWGLRIEDMLEAIGFLIFLAAPSHVHATTSPQYTNSNCTPDYLQGCQSCEQIARIMSKNEPNSGDYYRGAQWNGLYAAYVHNCFEIAESLLKRGANPNWGGWQGSMILSIVDKWPHDNPRINEKWAELFLKYKANAREKVPDQDKTPEAMVKDGDFEPDYPELWKKFLR